MVITDSSKSYLQMNFKSLFRLNLYISLFIFIYIFLAVNSYLMLLYLRAFRHQEMKSLVLGQTALNSEVQVRYCYSLQEENNEYLPTNKPR